VKRIRGFECLTSKIDLHGTGHNKYLVIIITCLVPEVVGCFHCIPSKLFPLTGMGGSNCYYAIYCSHKIIHDFISPALNYLDLISDIDSCKGVPGTMFIDCFSMRHA
jgi:hypothetical protein